MCGQAARIRTASQQRRWWSDGVPGLQRPLPLTLAGRGPGAGGWAQSPFIKPRAPGRPLIGSGRKRRGPQRRAPPVGRSGWAHARMERGGVPRFGRPDFLSPSPVFPLSPSGWGWYDPPSAPFWSCGATAAILASQLEGKRPNWARGAGPAGEPLPPHVRACPPLPGLPAAERRFEARRGQFGFCQARVRGVRAIPLERGARGRWAGCAGRGARGGAGRGRQGAGRGRAEPPRRVGGGNGTGATMTR